jgi:hypothetical protein
MDDGQLMMDDGQLMIGAFAAFRALRTFADFAFSFIH